MKNFKSFGIYGIIICALALSLNGYSQIVGPVGTRTISRLGTGSLGSPGDLQLAGPSPVGQGPIAAVSGLNFNFQTGVLLADSLPVNNANLLRTLDTTVVRGDTLLLAPGYTNIVVPAVGINTAVLVLPYGGNIPFIDESKTYVKYGSTIAVTKILYINALGQYTQLSSGQKLVGEGSYYVYSSATAKWF